MRLSKENQRQRQNDYGNAEKVFPLKVHGSISMKKSNDWNYKSKMSYDFRDLICKDFRM